MKFRIGDLVKANTRLTLYSKGDSPCVIEGEAYIVAKTEDGGVYLDHCSRTRKCSCLTGWWSENYFDHEEDPMPITPEDWAKANLLPTADDVAKRFGVTT